MVPLSRYTPSAGANAGEASGGAAAARAAKGMAAALASMVRREMGMVPALSFPSMPPNLAEATRIILPEIACERIGFEKGWEGHAQEEGPNA